jgi:hypothetical protein
MSAAQEEFDRLVQANKESSRVHPEDRHHQQSDNDSAAHSDSRNDEYEISDADSDYADRNDDSNKKSSSNMVSRTGTYTVPTTVFEANTGPKGVIADAQSFERARKKSFRRTLLSVAGLDSHSKNLKDSQSRMQKGSPPSEDEEDEFMRRWRESRMRELQDRSQRRPSPSKRVYGTFDDVDAEGYLNAIERVSSETVVVVCIYDPEVLTCSLPFLSHVFTDKPSLLSAPKSKTLSKPSHVHKSQPGSSSCTTKSPR